MSFLGPLLGGIASALIGGNLANKGQQQAQQTAAQDTQAAFNQQVGYIQQQEAALRNALAGVMGQGNPYFQAGSLLRPPTPYPMPGGGGQVFGGGSGVPSTLSPSAIQSLYNLAPAASNNPLTPVQNGMGQTSLPLPLRPPPAAQQAVPFPGGGHTRSLLGFNPLLGGGGGQRPPQQMVM